MDKILEALKGFLKDGTTVEAVKATLEPFVKEMNPLEGINSERLGQLIATNGALKTAWNSKLDEAAKKQFDGMFDKAYRERYTKEHPEEDPSKKEVVELRRELERERKERLRKELSITARNKLAELKIPKEFEKIVDRFVGDSEEETIGNLQALNFVPELIQKTVEEQVKGKFKGEPPKNGGTPPGKVTVQDMKDWTPQQINEAFDKGLVVG